MGNMNMSDFYCTQCGTKAIPIWRKASQSREAGHLKKLWCLKCQKETNHAEVRPFGKYNYEDFLIEYNYGNFKEDGTRGKKYTEFEHELRNKGVI